MDNSRIAKASRELASQLSAASGVPAPDQKPPVIEQRVFIDATLSMNGFVGDGGNNRTTFDEFIDAMPDVLPGCTVYKYGQQKGKPVTELSELLTKVEFDSSLHKRNFYQLEFNPDDVLFDNFALEQQSALSILITDGVESDPQGQINTAVVEAVKTWLGQGKVFAIVALKSKFSGRPYSERLRKMLKPVSIEARPFYAFIFSPNRREFDDLLEKIKRRFADAKTILFADDAISCTVEIPVDHEASYANDTPPDKPYYWQMIMTRSLREESEKSLVYKFVYEIKPTYPVKVLGIRFGRVPFGWDYAAGKFVEEKNMPQPDIDFDALVERSTQANPSGSLSQTFSLRPSFLKSHPSDFGFYALNQSAYIKEINDDIAALSTRDDSTSATADKTYRFQELVITLLDMHLKERIVPRVSPRLYLTATKR